MSIGGDRYDRLIGLVALRLRYVSACWSCKLPHQRGSLCFPHDGKTPQHDAGSGTASTPWLVNASTSQSSAWRASTSQLQQPLLSERQQSLRRRWFFTPLPRSSRNMLPLPSLYCLYHLIYTSFLSRYGSESPRQLGCRRLQNEK
jgi:hypothetical protein